MAVSKYGTSRCGLCRFYVHEGRRGGQCSQLDVPVDSSWKACSLAISPFASAGELPAISMSGITKWSAAKLVANSAKPAINSEAKSVANSAAKSIT